MNPTERAEWEKALWSRYRSQHPFRYWGGVALMAAFFAWGWGSDVIRAWFLS